MSEPEQPTVVVRMADAGHTYLSWRWLGDSAQAGVGLVPDTDVNSVVDRLSGALPNPATPHGLEHALTAGAFATYDAEEVLAQSIARAFLPYRLAEQLYDLYTKGVRPHIRLQPSPRAAQIPWELMSPDPGLRLVDFADVSLLIPRSIVHSPGRTPRSWTDSRHLPVVAVLDPRVPGFRADSTLGSVLGRMDATAPLAQQISDYAAQQRLCPPVVEPTEAFRRTDLDRTWLSEVLCQGASRLLYAGHVTAAVPESGDSENAEMHLACTADTVGFALPTRTHRPLSAKDFLLDPQRWPIPSRVALIACESGGDLRFTEALGLIAAMVVGGAELVTAGRWPLPTDFAFQSLAAVGSAVHPLQDAICAIDTAHEHPDPVAAVAEWQRERLAAWRSERTIEHSPVIWAALATSCV